MPINISMLYFYLVLSILAYVMVDNIKLRRRVRYDQMTNLFTREVFDNTLGRLLKNHSQFVVIYIDCDGFKAVNDRHGHKAGDELLCIVARYLKGITRAYDVVARLGGDEFAILLRDCDNVKPIIDRLKKFRHAGVTLSFGWASSEENDPKVLADERMYDFKRSRKVVMNQEH